jgi:hypothetical protein
MARFGFIAAMAAFAFVLPAPSAEITGQYVEARTCDVYTGPCFANADTSITGRHAVIAWKIDKGRSGSEQLDGLGVVAVIAARDTLGLKQVVAGKAIIIVDEKATPAQKAALIDLAQKHTGILLENTVSIQSAPINIEICECKGNSCAKVTAGKATVTTRCLDAHHDKACGNETAFYPPLSKGVVARPAMAAEHSYIGKEFNESWRDGERRGAYVGTFQVR